MSEISSTTHAVVIGGGIAGLLAAKVLLAHFERVTLIERDRFPEEPVFRAGVPQGRHPHILLERGLRVMEELFPGIRSKLSARSAGETDLVADHVLYIASQRAERFPSGLPSIACSRLLIEWQLRQEIEQYERLCLLEQHEVIGLLASDDRKAIRGVRLRKRQAMSEPGAQEELVADLVVDASGRHSPAPQWLEEWGYTPVEETVINAFLGYASRYYAIPADLQRDWHGVNVQGGPEEKRRVGVILPIEGNIWHVALGGVNKDYPPTQEKDFLAFAKSLPDPILYDAIKDAQPLSPIYGYRRTENRWRHFERMKRFPQGFVTLGDAVCAFNPVYGQGMSVAALSAALLKKELARTSFSTNDFSRRFQKRLAHVYADPWQLAASTDVRIAPPEGQTFSWMARLLYRYFDTLVECLPTDRRMRIAFLQVMHLLKPASTLFQPAFLLQVLLHALRKYEGIER